MKFSTRKIFSWVAVLVAMLFVYGVFVKTGEHLVEEEQAFVADEKVYLASSTLALRVGGIVASTDSALVAAQTSGVVMSRLVDEGDYVNAGDVLIAQSTPVQDAELDLQVANRSLSALQQNAQTVAATALLKKSEVIVKNAEDIAQLRAQSNDTQVANATHGAMLSIETSLTTLADAYNFVDTNRSLFDATSLRQYEQSVHDVYGAVPDYLDNGLLQNRGSSEDLLFMVESQLTSNTPLDPVAVQNLTAVVDTQLTLMQEVYRGAEQEVLDERGVAPDDVLYGSYFTRRENLLASQNQLATTINQLDTVLVGALEDARSQDTSVEVSEIDALAAEEQRALSQAIEDARAVVADASIAVVTAERSLGYVTAPFDAVVTEVFYDLGEYATAGAPVAQLVGVAGTEMSIQVPQQFAHMLKEGQVFSVDGKVVGVLERFAPVREGGSVPAVVALTFDTDVVGTSLVGDLQLAMEGTNFALPREYVHFSSVEPYIVDVQNRIYPVSILYDNGETLYVSVSEITEHPLLPSRSIDVL